MLCTMRTMADSSAYTTRGSLLLIFRYVYQHYPVVEAVSTKVFSCCYLIQSILSSPSKMFPTPLAATQTQRMIDPFRWRLRKGVFSPNISFLTVATCFYFCFSLIIPRDSFSCQIANGGCRKGHFFEGAAAQ